MSDKVSCIMCTYRRFSCVQRSIGFFLSQDYTGEKELIIYNTDEEHPLYFPYDAKYEMAKQGIKIYNNGLDLETNQPYTNVGQIRKDAVKFATGNYSICWDDDDIFLPYNISQCMDGIARCGTKAWKPSKSFFRSGDDIKTVSNTLEASVIVRTDELNYDPKTGLEHLSWYTRLRDERQLPENDDYSIPAYCFNWSSDDQDTAWHKQSGDVNNPDNFNNHKAASTDYARNYLTITPSLSYYMPYYRYFTQYPEQFPAELVEKYVQRYL